MWVIEEVKITSTLTRKKVQESKPEMRLQRKNAHHEEQMGSQQTKHETVFGRGRSRCWNILCSRKP